MAFSLPLSTQWASQGWKAKIRDKEGPEEPHVTVLRKTEAWRISLRTLEFLDEEPSPRHVPRELQDLLRQRLGQLQAEWDRMYPENRV